jgi:hypothetical protein
MVVNLLNIEATLRRLEDLGLRLEKQLAPREPKGPKKPPLTDEEWLEKMKKLYPTLDVPQVLREAEAWYVSEGQDMTRKKGNAWLKREVPKYKPVTVPAKKAGLAW